MKFDNKSMLVLRYHPLRLSIKAPFAHTVGKQEFVVEEAITWGIVVLRVHIAVIN